MARGNARDTDPTPAWLRDCRPIEVDLKSLGEFARVLREEVELNFQPHATRIFADLDAGTLPFQAKAGFVELAAASETYASTRDRALGLLQAYMQATRNLVAAAEQAAENYGASDAAAARVLNASGASRGHNRMAAS